MNSSGIVVHINPKGFGFIQSESFNFFFHMSQWSDILNPPAVGMAVTFDIAPAVHKGKKFQANNVTVVGAPTVGSLLSGKAGV
jgi:cold shock CspA family protein